MQLPQTVSELFPDLVQISSLFAPFLLPCATTNVPVDRFFTKVMQVPGEGQNQRFARFLVQALRGVEPHLGEPSANRGALRVMQRWPRAVPHNAAQTPDVSVVLGYRLREIHVVVSHAPAPSDAQEKPARRRVSGDKARVAGLRTDHDPVDFARK